MIVSTFTCAEATPRRSGGDPGPVGDPGQREDDVRLRVRDRRDDRLLHSLCVLHPGSLLVGERRAGVDAHAVVACQLHRAEHEHLRAGGGHLEHLVVGDDGELARLRHEPRIGGEHPGHVRVDLAGAAERGSEGDGGGVGAAAPERRDLHRLAREALEAGDEDDPALRRAPCGCGRRGSPGSWRVCEASVMIPACEPVNETASSPRSWIAIATSAQAIRSPVERIMSSSRGFGVGETSPASAMSVSVVFPIAETVPTTRSPRPPGLDEAAGDAPHLLGVGDRRAAELHDDGVEGARLRCRRLDQPAPAGSRGGRRAPGCRVGAGVGDGVERTDDEREVPGPDLELGVGSVAVVGASGADLRGRLVEGQAQHGGRLQLRPVRAAAPRPSAPARASR